MSGRVVSRSATTVEVDVGAGRIPVPASSVVRIEEGRSALQEYEERAAIAAADADAWIALGEWASPRGSRRRRARPRPRAGRPPNDPRANAASATSRWTGAG